MTQTCFQLVLGFKIIIFCFRVHIQVSDALSNRWQHQMESAGFLTDDAYVKYLLELDEERQKEKQKSHSRQLTCDFSSTEKGNQEIANQSVCSSNLQKSMNNPVKLKLRERFGRNKVYQHLGKSVKAEIETRGKTTQHVARKRSAGPVMVSDVCVQAEENALSAVENGNVTCDEYEKSKPEVQTDEHMVLRQYTVQRKCKRAVHRSRATQTRWGDSVIKLKATLRGEKQVYICEECGIQYASVGSLYMHSLKHKGKVKKCEHCNFTSVSKQSIAQHVARMHSKNRQRTFMCEVCGQGYYDKNTMLQHRRLHEDEGIPCELCGKKFKNSLYLKRHRRTHNEYEGTLCSEGCGKTFKSRANMLSHVIKIHTSGKSLQCPYSECSKTFRYRGILNNHIKTRHVNREKSIQCSWQGCMKTFREKKHLDVHVRIHTDEKPLKCDLCDYRCRQRNALNWHMKKHLTGTQQTNATRPCKMDQTSSVVASASATAATTQQQQEQVSSAIPNLRFDHLSPDGAAPTVTQITLPIPTSSNPMHNVATVALAHLPHSDSSLPGPLNTHPQVPMHPQTHPQMPFPSQHQPSQMQHPLPMSVFPQNLDMHYYTTNTAPYNLYERHDRGYLT